MALIKTLTLALVVGALAGLVNAACQSCFTKLIKNRVMTAGAPNNVQPENVVPGHRLSIAHLGKQNSVPAVAFATTLILGNIYKSIESTATAIIASKVDVSTVALLITLKLNDASKRTVREKFVLFNHSHDISSATSLSLRESTDDEEEIKEEIDTNCAKEVEREPTSKFMITAIGVYKKWISPLLPPACRFLPTCSQYGIQAIEEFGPTKGLILTAWRLARCSPLGGKGYDPPKWPPVSYTFGSY